jgi:hypothetical protein
LHRESVQQGREEGPVGGGEPWAGVSELAFQDHDLVAQRQDFHVLVPVVHRQQAQQRERVGHTEVGQSEQHNRSSCRVSRGRCGPAVVLTSTSAPHATYGFNLHGWSYRQAHRLGNREGAERATRRAQDMVDELDEPTTDAAFQFNDKRLLLYLSGTLTYMGETARARRVQAQALERYRTDPALAIDPALIRLDQAVGEASSGDAEGACELAVSTLEQLPPEHRTRLVLTRALDVVAAIPAAQRQRPAAQELRELVTTQENPV